MTSEDVTMFRKQLIFMYSRREIFYFCAAVVFSFLVFSLSLSLGENNFSRMHFCPFFFVCLFCCFFWAVGGDTKL